VTEIWQSLRKPAAVLPTREAEYFKSHWHTCLSDLLSPILSGCWMQMHVEAFAEMKDLGIKNRASSSALRKVVEKASCMEIKAKQRQSRTVCLYDVLSVCFETKENYLSLLSQNLLAEIYLKLLLYPWFCINVKLGLSL
jgi:hypothetical protein